MSDTMLFGVLELPYDMAMCSELSRHQFYGRAQEAVKRLRDQEAEIERLREAVMKQEGDASSALLRASIAESRLAAANALLRYAVEWNWLDEDQVRELTLQSHLQGAGDE
jgi:hypothetical protein